MIKTWEKQIISTICDNDIRQRRFYAKKSTAYSDYVTIQSRLSIVMQNMTRTTHTYRAIQSKVMAGISPQKKLVVKSEDFKMFVNRDYDD